MVVVQKRTIRWAISLLLVMLYFSGLPAQAQYGGGSGEPNDPYLIYTAEQMNAIGADANDWDKHFKLMADIDMAQYTGEQFNIIGYDRGWKDHKSFEGVFDGNNHSISHFTYASSDGGCIGLFGYVFHGELRNVRLVEPNVALGWVKYAGSLAGDAYGGKITNCSVEGGSVSGRGKAGGLVGRFFSGEMLDCSSTANVSGEMRIGGLVGESRGTLTNCHAAGDVSGSSSVGGLIGYSFDFDVVTACWSYSNVQGKSSVGGLVGNAKGSLQACYSAGNVTGTSNCGGLIGRNEGKVFWCYAEGTVTGMQGVGGLLAYNNGQVFSCYSTGVVTGETDVGGLVGRSWGGWWIQSCYWDTQTSGVSTSSGGVARSTMRMKKASTFRGWHSDGYWTLNEGLDYPRLAWETRAGAPLTPDLSGLYRGSGEPNDPYQIWTPEEFVSIAYRREDWGKHFILMRDLDMSGIDPNEIMPIGDGITPFSGVFDGAGHTISNYTCILEGLPLVGVFGIIVAPMPDRNGVIAVVENLHLVNAEVRGGGYGYVGGLVGCNRGTVTGCSVDGNVFGISQVGGLVGVNNGEINTCSTRGTVSSQQDCAGGLVGRNSYLVAIHGGWGLSGNYWAGISRSFSSAYVTGERDVGGLVGSHKGKIADCYSSGIVSGTSSIGGLVGLNVAGSITSCFWDMETSGQASSGGGTGKTTAEMQIASTFLDAGWDFVDESVNGTEDIWRICEGTNYPRLVWQIPAGDFVCPDGITIEDFVFFAEYWGNETCDLSNDYCQGTDLDFSGTVDEADLEILIENWLESRELEN